MVIAEEGKNGERGTHAEQAQDGRCGHGGAVNSGVDRSSSLAEEEAQGFSLQDLGKITALKGRAFLAMVDDAAGAEIVDLKSRLSDGVAEIYVLGVHEVVFVELANLFKHVALD